MSTVIVTDAILDRMLNAVRAILGVLHDNMEGLEQPALGKVTGSTMYLALAAYNGLALKHILGRAPTVSELMAFSMNPSLFENAAAYTVEVILPMYAKVQEAKRSPS